MVSLSRKVNLWRAADEAKRVKATAARTGRTGQVVRSTVPVGDVDVPVVEGVASAVDAVAALPVVEAGVADALTEAYEAGVRVDEAQAAADQVAADLVLVAAASAAAAQAASDAQAAAVAAQGDASQAIADAESKSAAARAAAEAFALAEANAAQAAAVAAASGDATAKAAAAQAAAVASAAADASSKANAAEAAAKADAAVAKSAADAAAAAAATAQAGADAVKFLAEGLFQAIPSATAPTTSPTGALKSGDQWWKLGSGDTAGKFIGVAVWNGTAWQDRQLVGDSILVPSSIGAVSIKDGEITGPKINVDALNFKTATGMELLSAIITAATIRTAASGQRLQLDAAGLRGYDSSGALTATIQSENGGIAFALPGGGSFKTTMFATVAEARVSSAAGPGASLVGTPIAGRVTASFDAGKYATLEAAITMAILRAQGVPLVLDSPLGISLDGRTTQPGNVFALKSKLDAWAPIDGTHAWVTAEGREYVRAGGVWVPQAGSYREISDWNAATSTGFYGGVSASNGPASNWYMGTVTVLESQGRIVQEVREANGARFGILWTRYWNGAAWSAWERDPVSYGEVTTVTVTASAGATTNVTFPTGKFTSAPIVTLGKHSSGGAKYVPYVQSVTATGMTIGVYSGDGSSGTASIPVSWQATQY